MLPLLRELQFDRLAAIPYAALPIGTALALVGNWPMIYPRREAKTYGTRSLIEGEYRTGDQVVVIDDLVTSGESKVEAIQKLEAEKLLVRDVLVLIDREQGATAVMASAGHRLHAVVTLSELLEKWRATDAISTDQYERVKKYLEE
jgi:uridine monophosphate synthetase